MTKQEEITQWVGQYKTRKQIQLELEIDNANAFIRLNPDIYNVFEVESIKHKPISEMSKDEIKKCFDEEFNLTIQTK